MPNMAGRHGWSRITPHLSASPSRARAARSAPSCLVFLSQVHSRAQLLALLETRSAYYDGFVEGAYLRVDDPEEEGGRHNRHRGKIVRADFIQGITTHWQSHGFVKNKLGV